MERITKKDRYGHFYTNKANCRNIHSLDGEKLEGTFFENQVLSIDGEAIDKLGQLEDIEDELGIDLITLFKASEYGFYMINEGQIKFVKQGYQFNLRGRYIHLNSGYKELDFKLEDKPFSDILLFKDYGATWSIDRKDLEQ